MKSKRRPEMFLARLLRKVVAEAAVLGELRFRRTLVEGEIRNSPVKAALLHSR